MVTGRARVGAPLWAPRWGAAWRGRSRALPGAIPVKVATVTKNAVRRARAAFFVACPGVALRWWRRGRVAS